MANFDVHLLSASDGSWEAFREDWSAQCGQVGEVFEEYASDSLKIIADIVSGAAVTLGGVSDTRVGALWDESSQRYYACWMLNHTMVPGIPGHTLRVRHILVSPLLDYGVAEVSLYPDVIIGILSGVVHLSSTVLGANHIRFHLRSPADQAFFRAIGTDLHGSGVFGSVQTHGAWLYITKSGAASTAAEMEQSNV